METQTKYLQGKAATGMAMGVATALLAGCSGGERAASVEAPPPAPPAAPAEISIPGTGVFPESLTATADGTVYIGSVGKAEIYRVAAGTATAEPFIAPATGGIKQVFGVLADEAAGTLWACSNLVGGGPPGGGAAEPSALFAFDLASGAYKASYAFPAGAFCNDIAIGPGGEAYASDTNGQLVFKLSKGGAALEAWSPAGAFGEPGQILDGIAVVGNRVVVNTLRTGKLFAVEIGADGKAGAVKELTLAAPLTGPDGMRAYGGNGLLAAASSKVEHITIEGDAATVTTVKDGLDGLVAVTTAGSTGYALEGQLGIMMAAPGTTPPAEKPYHAVAFTLP